MTRIHDTDSLTGQITVTHEDQSAFDLTEATVELVAQRSRNEEPVPAAVQISDAAGGVIDFQFSAGTFSDKPGTYAMQARVSLSGDVQTVISTMLTVLRSV